MGNKSSGRRGRIRLGDAPLTASSHGDDSASGLVAGFGSLSASPPPQSTKVRCFSCKSVLLVPGTSTTLFACPCGQKLKLPLQLPKNGEQIASMKNASSGIRCPRCLAINLIPDGAIVFPCECGLHLRRPPKDDPRPVSTKDSILIKADFGITNGGSWKRRQVTSERLGWTRVWNENEESHVSQNEAKVLEVVEEESMLLSDMDVITRLRRCLLEVGESSKKDELHIRVKGAIDEICSLMRTNDLKKALEDRLLDHSSLKIKRDLAQRLFCFEWSLGDSAADEIERTKQKGLVRAFKVVDTRTQALQIEFLPATEFFISTRTGLESLSDPPMISSEEIMTVKESFPFQEKVTWFQERIIERVRLEWEEGHVRVRVRRDHVLEDSFKALSKLDSRDMRRYFRFEFIGEPGQDAGGVAREWFSMVFIGLLDEKLGLFQRQTNGCYGLMPHTDPLPDDKKALYRFAGRMLGRTLVEGHNCEFSLTHVVYKHILAWVVQEDDLIFIDEQVATSTKTIRESAEVASLSLDFTIGSVLLKNNGGDEIVTDDTKEEYLDLRMKHILLWSFREGLKELLYGIYETVPLAMLAVFDPPEFDLLLCGLPDIDVEDWKANTVYRGEYAAMENSHPVIIWFWELLSEAERDERARFLQFATGTTRVPVQGFAGLQGNDGNVKLFTIESIPMSLSVFPRAHTCFNRIDLPMYKDKDEMKFRIAQALSLEGVGFQLE